MSPGTETVHLALKDFCQSAKEVVNKCTSQGFFLIKKKEQTQKNKRQANKKKKAKKKGGGQNVSARILRVSETH